MGFNIADFDANEVPDQQEFSCMPAGNYKACVINYEADKPTKTGNGSYLELKWQVVEDGEHKGRLVWQRLNLDNPNSTAVQIAQSELKSICSAVGNMRPQSYEDLCNIPVVIGIVVKEYNGNKSNEVKTVKSIASGISTKTFTPAAGNPYA